jgi:hypothetical protein
VLNSLGSKLFGLVIFKNTWKSKIFDPKESHHFVDLYELILEMYTVLGFDILFHKIIEENWK